MLGDSLICQISTDWVTMNLLMGQWGSERLPPANWKAELRVSKEQTKRKRRRKRRGILDRLIRTFLILFGLAAEVWGDLSGENSKETVRLKSFFKGFYLMKQNGSMFLATARLSDSCVLSHVEIEAIWQSTFITHMQPNTAEWEATWSHWHCVSPEHVLI